MNKNDLYIQYSRGNGAWCVMGANLQCWSIHDTRGQAEAEALALAVDLGVRYIGTNTQQENTIWPKD